MALLERVTTLVRANLNDLIDRAENPEKMLKQVVLDMQNQLIQLKTQVAIAMADQHLLAKKLKDNELTGAEWMRKAELAVEKAKEDLARSSIERALTFRQLSESFRQQLADQGAQVELFKSALYKLEQKLLEAQAKSEMLISQHRRAKVLTKAAEARAAITDGARSSAFDRMKNKVDRQETSGQVQAQLAGDDLHERLLTLGREDEIERLLNDIKARKGALVIRP